MLPPAPRRTASRRGKAPARGGGRRPASRSEASELRCVSPRVPVQLLRAWLPCAKERKPPGRPTQRRGAAVQLRLWRWLWLLLRLRLLSPSSVLLVTERWRRLRRLRLLRPSPTRQGRTRTPQPQVVWADLPCTAQQAGSKARAAARRWACRSCRRRVPPTCLARAERLRVRGRRPRRATRRWRWAAATRREETRPRRLRQLLLHLCPWTWEAPCRPLPRVPAAAPRA
mmetsp:Transcript_49964/g.114584  ORF Transcript_49964/g.114584 Transcript_49964/m.114584 type:complete len:228 (-) Transcript_49964:1592-2275(-)